MTSLLQTILFGAFLPPDVPSRKIVFDERSSRLTAARVVKPRGTARTSVVNALKRNPDEWMTIGMVSASAGCCDDTAQKILNRLASEQQILKRYAGTAKRGGKNAVFKWKNKNAKKQKTA